MNVGRVVTTTAGSGRNFQYYGEDVHVVAIDQSEKMLEQARKKKQRNVEFEVADVHELPFPAQSFDTVVDSFGLCSMENPVRALEEAQRVCKADGQILLLEHGKSTWHWLRKYMDNHAHEHAQRWGCWFNRDILNLVDQAGLDVVSIKRKHFGTTYLIIARPKQTSSRQKTQEEDGQQSPHETLQ
jgi:methyltransferase OMS1